jgi:hypothetical protein
VATIYLHRSPSLAPTASRVSAGSIIRAARPAQDIDRALDKTTLFVRRPFRRQFAINAGDGLMEIAGTYALNSHSDLLLLHFLQRLKMRAGHVARLDRDRLLRLRTTLLASHAHACVRAERRQSIEFLRALVLLPGSACQPPAALLIRVCAVTESEDRGSVFNSVCSHAGSQECNYGYMPTAKSSP